MTNAEKLAQLANNALRRSDGNLKKAADEIAFEFAEWEYRSFKRPLLKALIINYLTRLRSGHD